MDDPFVKAGDEDREREKINHSSSRDPKSTERGGDNKQNVQKESDVVKTGQDTWQRPETHTGVVSQLVHASVWRFLSWDWSFWGGGGRLSGLALTI